jgi:hypothetical protein
MTRPDCSVARNLPSGVSYKPVSRAKVRFEKTRSSRTCSGSPLTGVGEADGACVAAGGVSPASEPAVGEGAGLSPSLQATSRMRASSGAMRQMRVIRVLPA